MSYKPVVQVFNESGWHDNQLRFATHEEALSNARDLSNRWTLVRAFDVQESSDPVNYAYQDGRLVEVVS